MVGLVSYGAYIPKYRLGRDVIAQASGSSSLGGERAVASYDEDSLTMAVAAAFDCLGGIDPYQVDGLYFASTTATYKEKQSSSLIATVLDLRRDILTADFSNSLGAGASALRAGIDAIQSGSAGLVLVAIADCRLGAAGSELEQNLGDGAAAFLLGDTGAEAWVTGSYSVSDEFTDYWRTERDDFVKSWESRFANICGYENVVQEAMTEMMRKYNLTTGNFSRLVLYAPNPREHATMARKLGFDVKEQLSDLLWNTVGNTGTALAPMMLVAALEQARSGDKILFVSYGDGAQAFILEVNENINKGGNRRGIKTHLASKSPLVSYEKYLTFRNLIAKEERRRALGPPTSSLPLLWRGRKSFLGFYGSKCKRCSLIQHPVQRVCFSCQSIDDYEEVKLAKTGEIYTYTEDYNAMTPDLPRMTAVVILDDGTRVCLELVESEPEKSLGRPTKIGVRVEATFRRVLDASGFHSYYWKVRPIRGEG